MIQNMLPRHTMYAPKLHFASAYLTDIFPEWNRVVFSSLLTHSPYLHFLLTKGHSRGRHGLRLTWWWVRHTDAHGLRSPLASNKEDNDWSRCADFPLFIPHSISIAGASSLTDLRPHEAFETLNCSTWQSAPSDNAVNCNHVIDKSFVLSRFLLPLHFIISPNPGEMLPNTTNMDDFNWLSRGTSHSALLTGDSSHARGEM